jgi:hypothetical protein
MPTTARLDDGARQSWILGEPVDGVRIRGTHLDYALPPSPDDVIEVGSGVSSRFAIRIDSPHVSRLHCTIERRNGRWIVVDGKNKNGIFVGDERRTLIELVPGLSFRVGPVPLVAYSTAGQRARGMLERYFGGTDAHALGVEAVLASANEARHIIVQQPPGGGGLAIARAIHAASPRASWPIHTERLGETRREQLAALNATAYGTLATRSDQLPSNRDELMKTLAAWSYHVRFVLIAPRDQRVGGLVGDELLTAATLVMVPTIAERRGELDALVGRLRQDVGLRLGAPDVALNEKQWAYVRAHAWPENLEELERFVERVLALRVHKGNLRASAKALGLSPSAMIQWGKAHRIKALMD